MQSPKPLPNAIHAQCVTVSTGRSVHGFGSLCRLTMLRSLALRLEGLNLSLKLGVLTDITSVHILLSRTEVG